MSEQKTNPNETIYDKIRREVREAQAAEKERLRRLDQWAKQDDPQSAQDIWNKRGAN